MLFLLASTAFADDLVFGPDRPGVGESTTIVGTGHAVIEAGAVALVDPTLLAGAAYGRFGVHEMIELRVYAPFLTYVPNQLRVAGFGGGAKIAMEVADGTQISFVPEAFYDQVLVTRVGFNVAQQAGALSLWGHVAPSVVVTGDVDDRFGLLVGGGLSGPVAPTLSIYGHAGGGIDAVPFVGGGVAILVGSRFQIDLGTDATFQGGTVLPQLGGGLAVGF